MTTFPVGLTLTTVSIGAPRLAFNSVLGLQCFVIALSLDDFAAKNSMLHVEDRQLVVVHLLSGMLGHDVLTVSDPFSNSNQDSPEHSRPLNEFEVAPRAWNPLRHAEVDITPLLCVFCASGVIANRYGV